MHPRIGTRRKIPRRGQPRPPVAASAAAHPFRRTTSGFESLIPTDSGEDFFFSQWITDGDPVEFLEHGGENRDPLLGDPRGGMLVSAGFHVALVLFVLLEPNLRDLLNLSPPPEQVVAEVDRSEPLVMFMEEPAAPPLMAAVPAVPEAPVPQPEPQVQAQATPPPAVDNPMLIPKAMLPPDRRAEIMNDLPFSSGDTDEFYTDEEVKDPGDEGDLAEPELDEEARVAEQSPPDALEDALTDDGDALEDIEPEVADDSMDAQELSDFIFGEPELTDEPNPFESREESRAARRREAEASSRTLGEVGEGGENGRMTDIRRFLAGARFHNPEGGLVSNSDNTLYYNDKGANFVPWIRRMLKEVERTWRAGMPWAANIYAGHVAVSFRVDRSGALLAYETIKPSGVPGFDNIAVGAIRAADLLPLPADYPDEQFEIILVFWYNERPYDIFG